MSKEAVAAVMEPETKQEKLARLKKAHAKKENSLFIQIMESDLYDWNAGARMLLLVIAYSQRTNPDAYIPDDMPDYMKEDKCLGWCDMSQWRLALRCGKSESQINRDIQMFRKDGVVQARGWKDENKADHLMYRIVEEVVKEHKRPEQKKDVERPNRYKNPRPKKGWFSAENQPEKKSMAAVAGVNEDDA
jgi:hypothetical protein